MKVLVTGGTGVVGEAAVRALCSVATGAAARAARGGRRAGVARGRRGVAFAGDVTDPDALARRGRRLRCRAAPGRDRRRVATRGEFERRERRGHAARRRRGRARRRPAPGLRHRRWAPSGARRPTTAASTRARRSRGASRDAGSSCGRGTSTARATRWSRSCSAWSARCRPSRSSPAATSPSSRCGPTTSARRSRRRVERADLAGRTLDIAGPERTTVHDLLDRFATLTGRTPRACAAAGRGRVARAPARRCRRRRRCRSTTSQLTMLVRGQRHRGPGRQRADVACSASRPTGARRGAPRAARRAARAAARGRRRRAASQALPGGHRPARRSRPRTSCHALCRRFHELTPDQMDLKRRAGRRRPRSSHWGRR